MLYFLFSINSICIYLVENIKAHLQTFYKQTTRHQSRQVEKSKKKEKRSCVLFKEIKTYIGTHTNHHSKAHLCLTTTLKFSLKKSFRRRSFY